ncbi:MAG: hypothetical protein HND48_10440 [Chloroflexi bacterium]|nr:hypothetical protein [Chloroflexota bacterium]
MIDSTIVTIVLDGVVLALTFSFVLLLIWHNLSKRHIALLVTLLALVVAWNLGSIITKLADQFALGSTIVSAAAVVHDAGFAASSVAFYAFASSLTGTRAAPLLRAAWLGIGAVVIARLMFSPLVLVESGQTTAQLSPLPMLLFFAYSMFGVYQLFANRRKLTSPTILSGAALFVVGQGLTFANPAARDCHDLNKSMLRWPSPDDDWRYPARDHPSSRRTRAADRRTAQPEQRDRRTATA